MYLELITQIISQLCQLPFTLLPFVANLRQQMYTEGHMGFYYDRPNALFWLNWLQAQMLTDRSGDVEDRKIILLMNFHLMWQFEINLRWRRWVILCVLLDIGYLSLLWVKIYNARCMCITVICCIVFVTQLSSRELK